VTDAQQVPVAIADLLGIPLHGTKPPHEQVLDALVDRSLLLILDNLEHLLDSVGLLTGILERAPGVRILVTSRERLRIAGEWVFDLRGLALRGGTESRLSAAVALFVERAQQRTGDFNLTPANRALVTRICELVEGMPLGIELAAAWVEALPLAEIADEIARNLDFLERADRNAPARHRSLRAVFDHSWNLLSTEERRVFARLAVFRGGFTRDAAGTVAGASLALLAALVDKSLVRYKQISQVGRYELHELVRQYALLKLEEDAEATLNTHEKHCAYFAGLLNKHTPALQSSAAYQAWNEIASDFDNVRAAWAYAVKQHDHEAFAHMGRAIHLVCIMRGFFQEGLHLFREAALSLRAALDRAPVPPVVASPEYTWTLGHILSMYGNWAAWCGHFSEARERLYESYVLLKQRSDMLVESGTLFFLGYMHHILGDYANARAWLTQSIDLSRAYGNTYFTATSGSVLASVALAQGSPDALILARTALDDWQINGQPSGRGIALLTLGMVQTAQGALDQAEKLVREGLQVAASVQDGWVVSLAFLQLGVIALERNDPSTASYLLDECLKLLNALGNSHTLGRALIVRGWVAAAAGTPAAAQRWFEQASTFAHTTQMEPIRLDALFGLATLMAADAPGAALAYLDQIIAHAATTHTTRSKAQKLYQSLRSRPSPADHTSRPSHTNEYLLPSGEVLTPRELEVLALLVQGRSNQAIADELVVAVGTVKRHVTNILGKLEAQSRLEAVARARDLGLVNTA
jgi:predicted ATPase/DNA-binding CsgD family transcriptional regulator